ncbi:MAG: TIGR03086 family metal-binding protein, partial [Acidimicrobiales bacterium]
MGNPPSTESLSRAIAGTRAVLARVRPEQFEASTPCASWDVRALINHFVAVPRRIGARLAREEVSVPEDFTKDDLLSGYDESLKVALRAFEAPGATEKLVATPFGEVPGAFILGMVTADQFVHGWDLARATG